MFSSRIDLSVHCPSQSVQRRGAVKSPTCPDVTALRRVSFQPGTSLLARGWLAATGPCGALGCGGRARRTSSGSGEAEPQAG